MGYKKLELGSRPMSTRWLQDIIWQTGRELGHGKVFVDREEGVGGDDHEPFLRAGVDAVDLIQLNGSYPHWHKADDTIDKVSAQSMKIVGDTVLASLPKIVERLKKEVKGNERDKGKMLTSPEILVPIDFSPCSVNALRVAVGMAAPEGDLTLLHVVDEEFVQARLLPEWDQRRDHRASEGAGGSELHSKDSKPARSISKR